MGSGKPTGLNLDYEVNYTMHYYQFNIGDYKSHTDYLSPMEDLAYRRMIDWCYLHEKPLPSSPEEIARKIGLRGCVDEISLVLCDFFEKTDKGYTNQRISEEIAIYKSKADTARKNGKKGGRPRKETHEKPTETQQVILGNQEKSKSKANQEPLTINQEPEVKDNVRPDGLTNSQIKEEMDLAFEAFWDCWKACKKKMGTYNNSTPSDTRKKWDKHFSVSWWNKHTVKDFESEVNSILRYADEIHNPNHEFCPAKNMMTGKFFTNKGWQE